MYLFLSAVALVAVVRRSVWVRLIVRESQRCGKSFISSLAAKDPPFLLLEANCFVTERPFLARILARTKFGYFLDLGGDKFSFNDSYEFRESAP